VKFDKGEAGFSDGAVVTVLISENADAGGECHLGVVRIGDESQDGDFGGLWRQTFYLAKLFRFLGGYNPAVMRVVAAEAFGVAKFHTWFERPAEKEIVFGEELVEGCGVFFEFRVIEIRGE